MYMYVCVCGGWVSECVRARFARSSAGTSS